MGRWGGAGWGGGEGWGGGVGTGRRDGEKGRGEGVQMFTSTYIPNYLFSI